MRRQVYRYAGLAGSDGGWRWQVAGEGGVGNEPGGAIIHKNANVARRPGTMNNDKILGKIGTFQMPVDSLQETSGGGMMVIATSNR
jgi:hypothetical protein